MKLNSGFLMYRFKKSIRRFLNKKINSIDDYIDDLISKTDKNDLVIDIGANVGVFSKRFFPTGCQIYSIEPNIHAYLELRKLSSNYPKITTMQCAGTTHNGFTKLYLHQNHKLNQLNWSTGSSLYSEKTNVDKNNFTETKAIDIAEFIINLKRPVRILKIDIEGHEVELIPHLLEKGALNYVCFLIVETHDRKNPGLIEKTEKMKESLESANFNRVRWDYH